MKKPEQPKDFDEEIVMAKVRTSTFEWNVFIVTVFLLQITRGFVNQLPLILD